MEEEEAQSWREEPCQYWRRKAESSSLVSAQRHELVNSGSVVFLCKAKTSRSVTTMRAWTSQWKRGKRSLLLLQQREEHWRWGSWRATVLMAWFQRTDKYLVFLLRWKDRQSARLQALHREEEPWCASDARVPSSDGDHMRRSRPPQSSSRWGKKRKMGGQWSNGAKLSLELYKTKKTEVLHSLVFPDYFFSCWCLHIMNGIGTLWRRGCTLSSPKVLSNQSDQ